MAMQSTNVIIYLWPMPILQAGLESVAAALRQVASQPRFVFCLLLRFPVHSTRIFPDASAARIKVRGCPGAVLYDMSQAVAAAIDMSLEPLFVD